MSKPLDAWQSENYYHLAGEASLDVSHPGMKELIILSKGAGSILDLGCGEGSRLNLLKDKNKKLVGIDISEQGIRMARTQYKDIEFFSGDLEELPFKTQEFDLVFSAFVLEHLTNPAKVLDEALRVLKKGGKIVLIAPNYGAPNRCSPPYKDSRLQKLLNGFLSDLFSIYSKDRNLNWNKVEPISKKNRYEIDWDTTIEPYIRSLNDYLSQKNVRIININSCWIEELKSVKFHQKIFRFLGEKGIYPFVFWGPHLVLVGEKI